MDNKSGPLKTSASTEALKDLTLVFANAVGMLKIFPADHASVVAVREELWAKMAAFLLTHWELDLDVRETSFVHEGETLYTDDNLLKSLPYLFFKDGLEQLTFRRGLEKAEFMEFIDLVKTDALLPAEEGDIVNALWEKEFPHLGYQAAVDYLEAKISGFDRKPWETPVDTAAFSRGKVDLAPEDMEAVIKGGLSLGMKDVQDALDPADLTAPLDKKEARFIEILIDAERSIPAEKEFLELFFELLELEDRPAPIATMLQFLAGHHGELLKKGDYGHAAFLLTQMDALKSRIAGEAPAKSRDIDLIARRIRDGVSLTGLKEQAKLGRIEDASGFFRFLTQIGSRAIPLATDLFEEMEDGILRSEGFAYLKEIGRQNLDALTGLARETMPFLSQGIVAILAQMKERRTIPYLARFKDAKAKAVRAEAVQALAALDDPLARKMLGSFAADPDPEIRDAVRRALEGSVGNRPT
jgi:hypothetical protein